MIVVVAFVFLLLWLVACAPNQTTVTTVPPLVVPADPSLTKAADQFPVMVRFATSRAIGGEETETWYGDEIQWPQNPYQGGYPFVLKKAVNMGFLGRTIRPELVIQINDLILIAKPVLGPEQWEYFDDLRNMPEVTDKKYCRIGAYSGFMPVTQYDNYRSLRGQCESQIVQWGAYGQSTIFFHSSTATLNQGKAKERQRFFEIWVNGSAIGTVRPWGIIQ